MRQIQTAAKKQREANRREKRERKLRTRTQYTAEERAAFREQKNGADLNASSIQDPQQGTDGYGSSIARSL